MSVNRELVERYLALQDLVKLGDLLTDDAEWIEWGDGVPSTGVRSQGKVAYLANFEGRKLAARVTRLTEEGDRVVAEGTVQVPKKEGGEFTVRFIDIFELDHGKVRRLTSMSAVPLPEGRA